MPLQNELYFVCHISIPFFITCIIIVSAFSKQDFGNLCRFEWHNITIRCHACILYQFLQLPIPVPSTHFIPNAITICLTCADICTASFILYSVACYISRTSEYCLGFPLQRRSCLLSVVYIGFGFTLQIKN